MLIGNYSVLSKHPGRDIGGGATGLGYNRGDRPKTSMMRGAFTSGNWSAKSGIPDGYRAPYAWMLPIKPGAISARNSIVGAGDLTAAVAGGLNAEADLTGSGDLDATGQLIISMVASLVGSGDITNADAVAFLQLAASLAGAGDIAASLNALGAAAAALSGDGEAAATINALGTLAASLVVTGDALSTANVADAILDALNGIEQGLTVREAIRLIAAATAGKVSGAGTSTVTFRSAEADDRDRIIATVDGSGNRTAITTDLTD
jgi:hypothetical protein